MESVCGAASCQDAADLEKIQSWYESYCNVADTNPTTTSAGSTATSTSTGSGSAKSTSSQNTNQSW